MDHLCIYWHKIIDNGNSVIIMHPCINVSSRNDVVLNQKKLKEVAKCDISMIFDLCIIITSLQPFLDHPYFMTTQFGLWRLTIMFRCCLQFSIAFILTLWFLDKIIAVFITQISNVIWDGIYIIKLISAVSYCTYLYSASEDLNERTLWSLAQLQRLNDWRRHLLQL